MKSYKISTRAFLQVKPLLDQMVFWRKSDDDTVEVRPVFRYARQIVEKIANREKWNEHRFHAHTVIIDDLKNNES